MTTNLRHENFYLTDDSTNIEMDAETHELHHEELREHHNSCHRLRKTLPDWGYPSNNEAWLDSKFEDIQLGSAGPIEFRDVEWANLPQEVVKAAQETYNWLRRRRMRPMSLKSAARLAIRSCVIKKGQRSNLDSDFKKCGSLLELLNLIGLPKKLHDYLAFSNI